MPASPWYFGSRTSSGGSGRSDEDLSTSGQTTNPQGGFGDISDAHPLAGIIAAVQAALDHPDLINLSGASAPDNSPAGLAESASAPAPDAASIPSADISPGGGDSGASGSDGGGSASGGGGEGGGGVFKRGGRVGRHPEGSFTKGGKIVSRYGADARDGDARDIHGRPEHRRKVTKRDVGGFGVRGIGR